MWAELAYIGCVVAAGFFSLSGGFFHACLVSALLVILLFPMYLVLMWLEITLGLRPADTNPHHSQTRPFL